MRKIVNNLFSIQDIMSAEEEKPGEIIEEEEEEEESEDDDFDINEDEDEDMDSAEVMARTLVTEDGVTVATSLSKIVEQLEIQNKILVKMLGQIKN